MNNIAQIQNEERQIRRLAAQRSLYSRAKRVLAWQVWLIGPLSGVVAILASISVNWEVLALGWTVVALAVRHLFFEPRLDALREDAARIQDAFDCDVLEIDPRPSRTGPEPAPETIAEAAREYARRGGRSDELSDWYPPAVSELPIHLGRIVCQRQNAWWDASLRRSYAWWLTVALVILLVGTLIVAALLDWSIREWLVRLAIPFLPVFELGVSEVRAQQKSATRVEDLRQCGQTLWENALAGETPEACRVASRDFQQDIFSHRAEAPLVPDFVYRVLRDRMDNSLNRAAEDLVGEAKARLGA